MPEEVPLQARFDLCKPASVSTFRRRGAAACHPRLGEQGTPPPSEHRFLGEAEISGFEALGRANFDGGVPYGSDPLAQWRQQGCDYRTHMHADYERAASRQVAALAKTGGRPTSAVTRSPYHAPLETDDGKYVPAPNMNMLDGTRRQAKDGGANRRAPFGVDESAVVAYRTSAQDGAGSWSVPGREAGMDRSWDASVYNQNSMAGRIAARRLAGRSPRSPGVSTAIVPRK